jgi:putative transcriptional regulator
MKDQLVERVASLLREEGFQVSDCCSVRSCFDILARRDDSMLLVKILQNIEGLTPRSASELRSVASAMSGTPIVVGDHMKNAGLSSEVVYTRYGLHVVNIEAFGMILSKRTPLVYSIRGNYCVRIDPSLLSQIRKKADLTQKELAVELGVSKQSVHRYESSGRISLEIAEKLMKLLREDIMLPGEVFSGEISSLEEHITTTMTDLERMVYAEFRKMGFDASVTNAPFDIVAEERRKKERVLSVVSDDRKGLKRKIEIIRGISEMTGYRMVCISNRAKGLDVVVVKPRDLKGIKGAGEFLSLLEI